MFADMIIVFGLVNNNLERHPQCNFDEYIEEGFVEGQGYAVAQSAPLTRSKSRGTILVVAAEEATEDGAAGCS